jgi:hypothetical protein
MIPEIYKQFIVAIIEKTNNDEAKWTKVGAKAFVLKTTTSTLEIGYFTDVDADESYYYFKFFNFIKKVDAYFKISNYDYDFRIMEQLYTVAQTSANNIKDELASFLDELQ